MITHNKCAIVVNSNLNHHNLWYFVEKRKEVAGRAIRCDVERVIITRAVDYTYTYFRSGFLSDLTRHTIVDQLNALLGSVNKTLYMRLRSLIDTLEYIVFSLPNSISQLESCACWK